MANLGPRDTVGRIYEGITKHCCTQNIKALGFMVSEKMFYVFPIITLWELSVAMETRVPIGPGPKPNAAFFPTPTMLQIKFVCDRSAGLRDIHV